MTENMKKFLEAVSGREELYERLKAAGKDELIAIAKELGIALAETDFALRAEELSEADLNLVSGGNVPVIILPDWKDALPADRLPDLWVQEQSQRIGKKFA